MQVPANDSAGCAVDVIDVEEQRCGIPAAQFVPNVPETRYADDVVLKAEITRHTIGQIVD